MIKLFVFIYGKRMGEQISAIQISKPVFSWNIHKSKYFLPKKILENVIGFQVHVLCIRLYAKNIIWKAIAWVFNVKSMLWPQNDPRMSYCYFFTFFFFGLLLSWGDIVLTIVLSYRMCFLQVHFHLLWKCYKLFPLKIFVIFLLI